MNTREIQKKEDIALVKGMHYEEVLEFIAKLDPDGICGRLAKNALTGEVS